MQRGVAIHALGGQLWPKEAVCRTTILIIIILAARQCSSKSYYILVGILAHPSSTCHVPAHRLACSARSPAVTKLTVYRRLQVPAQDARTCRPPGKNVGQIDLCVVIALDPSVCFQRYLIVS